MPKVAPTVRGILVSLSVFTAACSILTPSQIKEVQHFADATSNYGAVPGPMIDAYGQVVTRQQLIALTANTYGPLPKKAENRRCRLELTNPQFCTADCERTASEKALCRIDDQRQTREDFAVMAARADAALQALDRYADALSELSSDDLSSSIDESAEKLGHSLDSAIKSYNSVSGNNLSLVGSAVAQAVAGAGRLYIRHRQSVLLKAYVEEGAHIVEPLTKEVEAIADRWAGPEMERARGAVRSNFTYAADTLHHTDLATILMVDDLLYQIDTAQQLAKEIKSSAVQYREAHKALVEALHKKQDLKGEIEQIKQLAKEVQAARKLRAKFKS